MSRIEDLLEELCPDGVQFRELGDVIALRFGTRITKMKDTGTLYPVYGGGGESFRTDAFNREDEYVVSRFAMSQACVRKVRGKFWMLDSGFTVDVVAADVDKHYVAYWLFSQQPNIYACSSKGAQKNLRADEFRRFRIPVPPLAIQLEIRRILDAFTELEEELEAELEGRRQQYAYYRDSLFAFAQRGRVRWALMGDVGEFIRGRRFTKDDVVADGLASIHYGEIYTRYGVYADRALSHIRPALAPTLRFAKTGDVVIAAVGETVEEVCKAVAWLGEDRVAIHDDCFAYRHSLNPKFVSYYFQTGTFHAEKAKHVARAKVKRMSGESLAKLKIPVPPLEEQERIVATLDTFDTLVSDLSIGLPAELRTRHQQYEHYRDRLLMFDRVAA